MDNDEKMNHQNWKFLFFSALGTLYLFLLVFSQAQFRQLSFEKGFTAGVSSVSIPTPAPIEKVCTAAATLMVPSDIPGFYVQFGETQLCAEVENGKIIFLQSQLSVGPDYDSVFKATEKELQIWKDCADSILLCPVGFKRSEPT